MVQAYHAVPVTVEHEDADNGPGIEHEGSALLGSRASSSRIVKSKAQEDGHATLTSSIGNLANTILGSGELHIVPLLRPPCFHSIHSIVSVSFCLPRFPITLTMVQVCSPSHGYVPSQSSNPCSVTDDLVCVVYDQNLASAGIIPGILTCAFSGAVAAFGLYLLSACARYTSHRRASFFAVASLTFPRAAVFFDAAIAIKCFGVSIRCARTVSTRDERRRLTRRG
jgi:hypothetical protein